VDDKEEKKKGEKDSEKKKDPLPEKTKAKTATKADNASVIQKNNKQMELLNR